MPKSQSKVLLLYILAYNSRFEPDDYYHSYKVFRYKRQLFCKDSNCCDNCEYLYREQDGERCKLVKMVNIIIKQ